MLARAFAAGCQELNLIPEVEGPDGKNFRFLGIQAKNRKEWGIAHIGNFHSGTTTIALYDTLGEEASNRAAIINGLSIAIGNPPP